MWVKFFTQLQLWINFIIFWQEIIKLFLEIAQFHIDIIDKAWLNICKFLNELASLFILILALSQNHIGISIYKSKNILKISLKMAEVQNDAYSAAFIPLPAPIHSVS